MENDGSWQMKGKGERGREKGRERERSLARRARVTQ